MWNTNLDELGVFISKNCIDITNRFVLKIVSIVFDALGVS